MNILITGANGFIGKTLVKSLRNYQGVVLSTFSHKDSLDNLNSLFSNIDILFHLAGVNRPKSKDGLIEGNVNFTKNLILKLEEMNKSPLVVVSSSRHALADNPYGRSKKASEEVLLEYSHRTHAPLAIYRLTNVFGIGCRPNYNSAVATFCYNIMNDLEINIHDENIELELVYVEEVVDQFLEHLNFETTGINYIDSKFVYRITLGELVKSLYNFKLALNEGRTLQFKDKFKSYLFQTFMSYKNYQLGELNA